MTTINTTVDHYLMVFTAAKPSAATTYPFNFAAASPLVIGTAGVVLVPKYNTSYGGRNGLGYFNETAITTAFASYGYYGFECGAASVTNDGTIVNGFDGGAVGRGIVLGEGGYIGNFGTVIAAEAVEIFESGQVVNGGLITNGASAATFTGILIGGTAANVVNTGTIAVIGTDAYSTVGVFLTSPGYVRNTGVITVNDLGIEIESFVRSNAVGTVVNSGTITATGGPHGDDVYVGYGIDITGFNGTVTNEASGQITGAVELLGGGSDALDNAGQISSPLGITLKGIGSVLNSGTIAVTGTGTDIYLPGGYVNNSGRIIGGSKGIAIGGSGSTVVNSGTIDLMAGTTGYGVQFDAINARLTNAASGYINGSALLYNQARLVNAGAIVAPGTDQYAVNFKLSSGYLDNSGRIAGALTGVAIANATVINSGTIQGTRSGLALVQGSTGGVSATLTNTGAIYGGTNGIVGNLFSVTWSIDNTGTISAGPAGGFAVELNDGGYVENSRLIAGGTAGIVIGGNAGTVLNLGTISDSLIGVKLAGGGTVTDAGLIVATGGTAVYLGGTGSNRLVLAPGYRLSGAVVVSGTGDTLELGSGTFAGTIAGIGTSLTGFALATVDADADWILSSSNIIAAGATLIDGGTVTVAGSLAVSGVVNGGGALDITGGGVLERAIGGGISEAVTFTGAGEFKIDGPTMPTNTISGFTPGDTIDLTGLPFDPNGTVTLETGDTLSVAADGTTVTMGLVNPTLPSGDVFTLSNDGSGGTLIGEGPGGAPPPLPYAATDPLMTNTAGTLVFDQVVGNQMVFTTIGGLGPEWEFDGSGLLLGDGNPGFLIRDTGSVEPGALFVGEVVNGQAQYTPVGGLGLEWQFEGDADFLGTGQSEFLIRNTGSVEPGALFLGQVVNGAVQYTALGGLGLEWQFDGAGDFLNDGNQGFLVRNTGTVEPGALDVGEVVGGAVQYTQIGGIGPEWDFEGTGDFLGDGNTGFLLWNSGSADLGAMAVGEVVGGQLQFTDIGGVGPEWQFVGIGNYVDSNKTDFLLRNTNSGALVVGSVSESTGNATVYFATVGSVGSEWTFHNTSSALMA